MKNPVRVMALQTQRVPSNDGTPAGGGAPEIDQATAAGLCAGMPRPWYLAARLKWARDRTVAAELVGLLLNEAERLAQIEKWQVPEGREYLRRMADLAAGELMDPARWRESRAKAVWLGMSKTRFSRVWQDRYNAIYLRLEDWSSSAFGYIANRQRRG